MHVCINVCVCLPIYLYIQDFICHQLKGIQDIDKLTMCWIKKSVWFSAKYHTTEIYWFIDYISLY